MNKLLWFENRLTQAETWILVGSVLTMLVLAAYNVAYRNVLVPIQAHLLTSGPVPTAVPEEPPVPPNGDDGVDAPSVKTGAGAPDDEGAGGFGGAPDDEEAGGFGGAPDDEGAGGFGGAPDEGEAKPAAPDGDGAGGFGGAPDEGEAKPAAPDGDGAGGFGGAPDDSGGFGGAPDEGEGAKAETMVVDSGSDRNNRDEPSAPEDLHVTVGGLPPEGSAAAHFIAVVNWLKLSWIDILLRQFVLITGLLGGMLATTRRKHINIDAVSRFLPAVGQRIAAVVTNLASVIVCGLLAMAGADLVSIGIEFPRELVSWAEEWVFQLVFPIGFGLLAVHFLIRTAEAVNVLFGGTDDDQPSAETSVTADSKGGEA